ncbi:hypothetical protein V3C99_012043 [Haemonchus contortus]|uniref:Transposase n=1 Tax=Haemonchus contortus TaxID=6289 RepID=A0A7I4Y3C6_HAECO
MRYSDGRWTRAVTDWISRNIKRTPGWPPARWSNFFTNARNERSVVPSFLRASIIYWTTLARNKVEWRHCSRPLEEIEDTATSGDTGDPPP